MDLEKPLTISKFARLTGIKRDNLRFYDRIGLLSPEIRGENGYRYYSQQQLTDAYLIYKLREVGVGLDNIREFTEKRTGEKTLELFLQHDTQVQAEIRRLQETSQVLQYHIAMMREASTQCESTPFLQEQEAEPIFLCPPIPVHTDPREAGDYNYGYAKAHGVDCRYPLALLVAHKRLGSGEIVRVESPYFKVNRGANACKPGGLYAVAYDLCTAGPPSDALYLRLLDFTKDQDLCVCGDAYEEFPFGILAIQGAEYCYRVEIPVTRLTEA